MNTEKIYTDKCPNCGNQIIITNGWTTFLNGKIASIDVDWKCPECEKTSKLDIDGYKDQWQQVGRGMPKTLESLIWKEAPP